MQSLDYPNTEEKRRGRKKAPERERERATTPLNLLTSSRECLKQKSFCFYKNRNYTKFLVSPLFGFLF
jgi:hypothetical protein